MKSIMLLTFNRLQAVRACLESLVATGMRDDVEVLIVENASTDGTTEWLRAECPVPCEVSYEPANLGVSGGRKVLLEKAQGDILIFLDSDTVITDSAWLEKLTAPLTNENIGLCGPPGSFIAGDWSGFYPAPPGECDVVGGWCQAFKRELLDYGLHMRTEEFPMFWTEDSAWCLDIRALGFDIWSTGDIGVQHHPGLSGDKPGLHEQAMRTFRALYQGKGLTRAEGGY